MTLASIISTRKYSEDRIQVFKERLAYVAEKGCDVVITGSFARLEAHTRSDVDYFVLRPEGVSGAVARRVAERVRGDFESLVENQPKPGGPWASFDSIEQIDANIGGNKETNNTFTRRILFLIESRSLFDNVDYQKGRKRLIDRYIRKNISDHQIVQFFLNDLIRYYRTICVDFEHKTHEQNQSWGLTNIKLVFSRKILYYSAVLVVAETFQRTYLEKVELFSKYFQSTPVERVEMICGRNAEKMLSLYDEFLGFVSVEENRKMLETVSENRARQPESFRRLKNLASHFTNEILLSLNATYPLGHPIHRALIS